MTLVISMLVFSIVGVQAARMNMNQLDQVSLDEISAANQSIVVGTNTAVDEIDASNQSMAVGTSTNYDQDICYEGAFGLDCVVPSSRRVCRGSSCRGGTLSWQANSGGKEQTFEFFMGRFIIHKKSGKCIAKIPGCSLVNPFQRGMYVELVNPGTSYSTCQSMAFHLGTDRVGRMEAENCGRCMSSDTLSGSMLWRACNPMLVDQNWKYDLEGIRNR